ncbi:hypothetical protein B9Z55_021130 [Caenorhabditis nigoni]|uniref:Lin-15A/B-like domain-containing protein n=1 Tax=Caenorhabditis nigoni TaxID=1611254 RepID=A0A2G5TQT4_9PELO|nr:hypothetical protein B9Z55_021130 [Caenorhabditis nigoni]
MEEDELNQPTSSESCSNFQNSGEFGIQDEGANTMEENNRPADTPLKNVMAQFMETETSSESTKKRRKIVLRRVVKRKAEQSEDSDDSRMLISTPYATSSGLSKNEQRFQEFLAFDSQNLKRKKVEQSGTSPATSSMKSTSSGNSESLFYSSATLSDPFGHSLMLGTSSEKQNSEASPGTSTNAEQSSEFSCGTSPSETKTEKQKPEKFRPAEYPSFKILEETRKSGESESPELQFEYPETEEELESEPIRDEQCSSEAEQCPMSSTSSGIRDEQSSPEIETDLSLDTTKCPICNQPKSIIDLVPLVGKYEKLVVLIPWVIDGLPIEKAIALLNSEEFHFVCPEHPKSTVSKYLEYLNVSSIEELEKINIGPKNSLTIIAQSISRLFSIGLKRTIFKFCEKFESQESYNQFVMEELERRENEEFRDQMKCVVCRKEEAEDLRKLGDSEEKLIFLSAFLDKITVETARSICKSNGAFRACDSHFDDIFKRTFQILPVSRIVDIKQCSIKECDPWMGNVRRLRSDITSNQYLDLLQGFCAKNGAADIIETTSENVKNSVSRKCENEVRKSGETQIQMANSEKCVICQKVKIRPLFRKTQTFIERLIVLTGWILTDKKAEIRAMSLLNEQISFVCWSHFTEFSGRILDELCIKNRNELSTCYRFLVKKLMKTVNILAPYMKKDEFLNEFELWLKASSNWCKPNSNFQFDKQVICSFCIKKKNEPMKRVDSREDKLILMIASVLDKRFEMDIAISFVRSQKECFICFQHFQSSIDRIFQFLSIQQMYQLSMCRQDLMQNLMVIVHKLNGEVRITTNEFRQIMSDFYENHCRRMNPLPKCPTRPHIRK